MTADQEPKDEAALLDAMIENRLAAKGKTLVDDAQIADDALWVLVRLLAWQAARDRLAGSPAPADPSVLGSVALRE